MPSYTVLLIDDDVDSIAIYSLILEHHGYRVLHARDGENGLRLALEARPDLVVSELYLGPLGTVSIPERLRDDERTAGLPVIVLDSIPSFAHEYAASIEDFVRLTKPCEPSRLLLEVQRVLAAGVPLAG